MEAQGSEGKDRTGQVRVVEQRPVGTASWVRESSGVIGTRVWEALTTRSLP